MILVNWILFVNSKFYKPLKLVEGLHKSVE